MLGALIMAMDWISGAESMGGGDLKLYALAAFYFGWERCLVIIGVSCILGALTALLPPTRAEGAGNAERPSGYLKRSAPFGPAIALVCMVVALTEGIVL